MENVQFDRLEGALSLSPAQRAAALLALPEDQWFDRKSARITPRKLAETLVAFANADGGTVVVGLSDGSVDADLLDAGRENAVRQTSLDYTTPPVRMNVESVSLGSQQPQLLVLRVAPGEQVHETTAGDCFMRVGDESRRLSFAQRQELAYDRGASQFDGSPVVGAKAADLDPEQMSQYRTSIGATADDVTALRARNLLTPDGKITVAAILLLGRVPQVFFPNALVRVLRYQGTIAGTGASQALESGKDRRFEGTIPDVIRSAAECATEWMPKRRALGGSGRFEDIPLIPRDAWLEGLVNAVVHRSYSLAGDHIRVSIFSDRVEIESPGRFPGLADPRQPLEIARYARNPRIARVCSDLGITLERGEGIKRMFAEMRELGLTDPVYDQTPGSVKLTLIAASRLPLEIRERIPAGADDVVRVLRQAGRPLGTGELMELLHRSRPWTRHVLDALRDEGVVSWEGKSARDPRATWTLQS